MGTYINRDFKIDNKVVVTKDFLLKIHKDLTLIPYKESYSGPSYLEEPENINFYIADKNGVYIPYAYCSAILGQHLNFSLTHHSINIQFKGDLLEKQRSVVSETINFLNTKGGCILNVPPGFGKTVIGAYATVEKKLLTVILMHRDTLVGQWRKTFEDHTNAKIWVVGENDHLNWSDKNLPDVIICMDQRVRNIPIEIRKKVGLMIIDEAHCFCTKGKVESILGFQPKYILAETATLIRSDKLHQMIYLICGMSVVNRKIEKEFKVFKVNTKINHPYEKDFRGKIKWNTVVDSMINNEKRNSIISNIVSENKESKILILTASCKHVKILTKLIINLGEKVDTLYGKKKTYNDSRVLIGTISKIGTGFDEKNACKDFSGIRIDLVILATSIKSLSLLEQNVGRGFRSDLPKIYDIVDNNPSILKNHFYNRKKWYDSNGGTIEYVGCESEKLNDLIETVETVGTVETVEMIEMIEMDGWNDIDEEVEGGDEGEFDE